ncbi:MAG: DUF748 domain-containing protein [Bacteroidota bacterium]
MKLLKTKLRKTLFRVFLVLIILIVLIIAFISPLTKWAIEKYDYKYTGREITLDLAYVNPFTGYVHLKNLQVHEAGSDSVFFSAKGISSNFELLKLFSKTYEIGHLTLTDPVAKIIQNKKDFNFDDLIKKFSSADTIPKIDEEPAHFNLLNVKIENGTFYYIEKSIPVFYFIKKVNIETGGKRWDADTMDFKYSLASGIGSGDLHGTLDLNVESSDYKLAAVVNKFDISILEQYVQDIANYGKVRGNVDADLKAEGNFKNAQDLNAKGLFAVNDFHIGKNLREDYVSFKKLSLGITELSPQNKKYFFDSVSLIKPYFKYERYDYLDNLQYMFGKNGERVEEGSANARTNILFQIADYIKLLAKNFFKSDYKLKRLAIYDADIRYNDYALNEKFAVAVSPLTVIADSIERGEKWVNLRLRAGIKPYGNLGLDVSINPKDSSDFNFRFYLDKVPMAMLNPYFITYTSFPLDRGIVEVKGNWHVRNGVINSTNNLVVIDPRINNRQKRNGAKWLPLRFFMFFVRDRGNVIDYEVPINGDLKDPKFKLRDVILDVLTNIFVKPVTVPYRTQVRNVENEIEKTLTLKWTMRGATFSTPQEKFIKKIVEFLQDNPGEHINIQPEFYAEREKEYILFYEAKKVFYCAINKKNVNTVNGSDSTAIEKIPVKDSAFIHFLNKKAGKEFHTVQEKCAVIVSNETINKKWNALKNARKAVLMGFFNENQLDKRVKLNSVKHTVPFNGFSLYRISYKGDFPEEVREAYEKMNELDENSPRNKFKEERKNNRRLLDAE